MNIIPYKAEFKTAWDDFTSRSKNATFLFHRDYMDYHAQRFDDCSVLIVDDQEIVALFPASFRDQIVSSHGGLTYGGILADSRMTAKRMMDVLALLKDHYRSLGMTRLVYKVVPSIYAQIPSAEDLYALYRADAVLLKREISSAIVLPERLPFAKGKKYNVSKARNAGLTVREMADYAPFWTLETEVLKRHNAAPVHSLEEISLLAGRFPHNIRLFGAFEGEDLLAGTVIYQNRRTAHTQYMAASDRGRNCGALDAVIAHLLDDVYKDFLYFDFGISTEEGGRVLNEGLIAQKEMFGGRAVMYETYGLDL
jgi:hypothetical protein